MNYFVILLMHDIVVDICSFDNDEAALAQYNKFAAMDVYARDMHTPAFNAVQYFTQVR